MMLSWHTSSVQIKSVVTIDATTEATVASEGYPMRRIWTTPEEVRNAPRVYH